MSQIRTLNPIIDEAIEKENMEDAEDEAIWNRVREEEAERLYQTQINWAKREGEARGEEKGKLKGIVEGKREGRLEGKREGRLAEKREVIMELYKMNFNIDKISKIVKLSKEEITKIIKGKKRLTN